MKSRKKSTIQEWHRNQTVYEIQATTQDEYDNKTKEVPSSLFRQQSGNQKLLTRCKMPAGFEPRKTFPSKIQSRASRVFFSQTQTILITRVHM